MPIELPEVRWQVTYPKWIQQVSQSRAGAKTVAVVEYGPAFWQIPMATKPLSPPERLLVEAFADQAREGLATVLYTPKHSVLPQAYWGNPDAAELDAGTLSSKSGYGAIVGGVADGLLLNPGDLISMTTGSYNAMFRVQAAAIASGGSISLSFNWPVPSYIGLGAIVRFKNPLMNSRLMPNTFSISDERFPVATFTLFEVPL